VSQITTEEWAGLKRYAAANASLKQRKPREKRTVFFGDSITEAWNLSQSFPGRGFINRGISGQTTPQMLIRFRQDVVNLQATRCVILGGTNDLAGNTGEASLEEIQGYLASLCEIAHENDIKVFLASLLPVIDYPWSPGLNPAPKVKALNKWLRKYARQKGFKYLDYYSRMADKNGALKQGFGDDGVHPNDRGYAIMQAVASAVL
jgi:lysophospholipase L1-like esterase